MTATKKVLDKCPNCIHGIAYPLTAVGDETKALCGSCGKPVAKCTTCLKKAPATDPPPPLGVTHG